MTSDRLSLVFGALADPTRRAIVTRLSKGEASVSELARPFEMSLPAVSKHLKVLERAGLVERARSAQYRPARLNGGALREAEAWIERYRQHWEEKFDRLDAVLQQISEKKERYRGRRR